MGKGGDIGTRGRKPIAKEKYYIKNESDEVSKKNKSDKISNVAENNKNEHQVETLLKQIHDDHRKLGKDITKFGIDGAMRYKAYPSEGMAGERRHQAKETWLEIQKDTHEHNETLAWGYRTTLSNLSEFDVASKSEFNDALAFALEKAKLTEDMQDIHKYVRMFESLPDQLRTIVDRSKMIKGDDMLIKEKLSLGGEEKKLAAIRILGVSEGRTSEQIKDLQHICDKLESSRNFLKGLISESKDQLAEDQKRLKAAKEKNDIYKKYIDNYGKMIENLKKDTEKTSKEILVEVQDQMIEAKRRVKDAENRLKDAENRLKLERLNDPKRPSATSDALQAAYQAKNAAQKTEDAIKLAASKLRILAENNEKIDKLGEELLISTKKALDVEANVLEKEKQVAEAQYKKSLGDNTLTSLYDSCLKLASQLNESLSNEELRKASFHDFLEMFSNQESNWQGKKEKQEQIVQLIEKYEHIDVSHSVNMFINEYKKSKDEAHTEIENHLISLKIAQEEINKKITERTNDLRKRCNQEHIQDREDGTQGYLFYDPHQDKMSINGVYTDVKMIGDIVPHDVPGQSRIELRRDLTEIRIDYLTKDGSVVPLGSKGIYTKRAKDEHVVTERYELRFTVEGKTYAGNGRRYSELFVLDKSTGMSETYTFDMQETRSIRALLVAPTDGPEQTAAKPTITSSTQATPDLILDHAKLNLARDGKPGYDSESMKKMWRVHLPTRTIIFPNGLRINISDIDWTETKWSPERGLCLVRKGPTENSIVNLSKAGSNLNLDWMANIQLKKDARELQKKRLECLDMIFQTGDRSLIQQAASREQMYDALNKKITNTLAVAVWSPPKTNDQLDSIKEKTTNSEEWFNRFERETFDAAVRLQTKSNDHAEMLKDHIQDIYNLGITKKKNDHNRFMIDGVIKDCPSDEAKDEIKKKVIAAWHLDETFHLKLLNNPELATAFITSIAARAGKAKRMIEEIDGQHFKNAIKAQEELEKEITNKAYEAISEAIEMPKKINDNYSAIDLSRNQNKSSDEIFQEKIRGIIYHVSELEMRADIIKKAQSVSKFLEKGEYAENVKNDAVGRDLADYSKKIENEIINQQIKYAEEGIFKVMRHKPLFQGDNIKRNDRRIVSFQEEAKKEITKAAADARKAHNNPVDSVKAAARASVIAIACVNHIIDQDSSKEIKQLEMPEFRLLLYSHINGIKLSLEIDSQAREKGIADDFNNKIANKKRELEKAYKENSYHANSLVKKSLKSLEDEIKMAKESVVDGDEEKKSEIGLIVSYRFNTYLNEYLELCRAQFAASKSQGKDDRSAGRDVDKETGDIDFRSESLLKREKLVAAFAPRRGHLAIDVNDGHITLGNHDKDVEGRFYLQEIQQHPGRLDNCYTIPFKNQIENRANGLNPFPVHSQDHLSADDDSTREDWAKKTYIKLDEPTGRRDDTGEEIHGMLYTPNGMAVPLDYIDWDKTEQSNTDGVTITFRDKDPVQKDMRGQKINLKAAAEDMTFEQQNEAEIKIIMREVSKKCAVLKAIEDYAKSERFIAEEQGKNINTVINALDKLKRQADDAANAVVNQLEREDADNHRSQGDFDEKSAAYLDLFQRKATAHKKIAQSVKEAADQAEETARRLGKDVAQARKKAACEVKGFADIAEQSAKGAGKDVFNAAVIAAEKTAATLVADAISQSKAWEAAQRSGELAGIRQEETALRIADKLELASFGVRSNRGIATIETSREEAKTAAREYARLGGEYEWMLDIFADNSNEMINSKFNEIDNSMTNNDIPDDKVRDIVKNTAKNKVALMWSLVEKAKLDAIEAKISYNEIKSLSISKENRILYRLEIDSIVEKAMDGKKGLEASAAAVVAAKEHATFLQAQLQAAKAERDIVRETGGDNGLQLRAIEEVMGTGPGSIRDIYNQGGLVAVVRYATSRALVAEAANNASKTVREYERIKGSCDNVQYEHGHDAAKGVINQAQATRDSYPHDSVKRDIESAVAAQRTAVMLIDGNSGLQDVPTKRAKQSIANAVEQVRMIKELAMANEEVAQLNTLQILTVGRIAAAEIEIADLIKEAPDQQVARDLLKASKEAAARFQAEEKAVKYTKDIQAAIMSDMRTMAAAVENAKQTFEDRFKQGGLVAAVRYAESQRQVAKALKGLPVFRAQDILDRAASFAGGQNPAQSHSPYAKDIGSAIGAAWNRRVIDVPGSSEVELQQVAYSAEKSIIDAINEPTVIKKYYGNSKEEYEISIRAAREALIAARVRLEKDSKAVKEVGVVAADKARISASNVSHQVEMRRKNESDQVRETDEVRPELGGEAFIQDFSRRQLADIRLRANKSINEFETTLTQLEFGSIFEPKKCIQDVQIELKNIVCTADQMCQIRGGDSIDQDVAKAEAIISYTTYLDELTKAAKTASREAAAVADFAGQDAESASRQALTTVVLRGVNAVHEADLQGKNIIDKYAAAAANVAQFAQDLVELKRSTEAVTKAVENRAKVENLSIGEKELEKQYAANKVLTAFNQHRFEVAKAKFKQAKEDGAIFAGEVAEMCGENRVEKVHEYRAIIDSEVKTIGFDSNSLGESDPLQAELAAKVAIGQATMTRAFRDIVKAGQNISEIEGREASYQHKEVDDIRELISKTAMPEIEKKIGYVTQFAEFFRTIETACQSKRAVLIKIKEGDINGKMIEFRKKMQDDIIKMKDDITNTELERGQKITKALSMRMGVQFAMQIALEHNLQLYAAINTEDACHKSGIKGDEIDNKIKQAIESINETHRDSDSALANMTRALQQATVVAKITQAVKMSRLSAKDIIQLMQGDIRLGKRRVAEDTLSAATNILYSTEQRDNKGRLEDAFIAASQRADFYAEIAGFATEVGKYAKDLERTLGTKENKQKISAKKAVKSLLDVVNEANNQDQAPQEKFIKAIEAAKTSAASMAKITEAVKRVYNYKYVNNQEIDNQKEEAQKAARELINHIYKKDNSDLDKAYIAAKGAENFISGHDFDDDNNNANIEGNRAKKFVEGAKKELKFFDCEKQRKSIKRELDYIEAIAKNTDVLRAINDAGNFSAEAGKLTRKCVNEPTDEEINQELYWSRDASQAVLQKALDARKLAKATNLSEIEVKALEAQSAASTTARYTTSYAVAISAREVESKINQQNISEKVRRAINDQRYAISQRAARKAGLQLGYHAEKMGELTLDPAVVGDSFIHEAKVAIRQMRNALGERAHEQMKLAEDFERGVIFKANEIYDTVLHANKTMVGATLAAVAFIEWRLEIKRAQRDMVLAAREIAELTGVEEPEKLEKAAQIAYDHLEREYKYAEEIAEKQGLDDIEKIAAGAAKIRYCANMKQNERDAVLMARESAGPDKTAQIDAAKKAIEKFREEMSVEKEVQVSFTPSLVAITAKDSARYAIAQAKFAHAVNAMALHVQARKDQLSTVITPNQNESLQEHQERVVCETTQLMIQNMKYILDCTKKANANLDPVTALEKGVAKATEYVAQCEEGTIIENSTAFTGAERIVAHIQSYASKAVKNDIDNIDVSYTSNTSEKASIIIAEELVKESLIEQNRLLCIDDINGAGISRKVKEIENAAKDAKAEAQARGENETQQSIAAIEAVIKIVADKTAFVHELKKPLESAKNGTQVPGFDINREIRKIDQVAVAKGEEVLETELKTVIGQEINRVRGTAKLALASETPSREDINPKTPDLHHTIESLCDSAQLRIEKKVEEVRNSTQDKNLYTQYIEAIAAAKAQSLIEGLRISVFGRRQKAMIPADQGTESLDELNELIDGIAKQAQEHAGSGVNQHVAASVAVAKWALLQNCTYLTMIHDPLADQVRNEWHRVKHAMDIEDQLGMAKVDQGITMFDRVMRLKKPGATEFEQNSSIEYTLHFRDMVADEEAKKIFSAVGKIQKKAEQASLDEIARQASLREMVVQALQEVAQSSREAADMAGGDPAAYTEKLGNWVKEMSQQEDVEALRQAGIVLPKLASDMQDVARASKEIATLFRPDKQKYIQKYINESIDTFGEKFFAKLAFVRARDRNPAAQLIAGGEAATRFAERTVRLSADINVLASQIQDDIRRIGGGEEQTKQKTEESIAFVLQQVEKARADSKAANKKFKLQDQVVATRKASLEARMGAISSGKMIDETVTEVARKISDEYLSAFNLKEFTALEMIEEYEKYALRSNLTLIEQKTKKRFEDFFDDKDNKVHPTSINHFNIVRALVATRYKEFDKAFKYLKNLETITKPSNTDTIENRVLAIHHAVAEELMAAIHAAGPQVNSVDASIIPILVRAKSALEGSTNCAKATLKLLDQGSDPKAEEVQKSLQEISNDNNVLQDYKTGLADPDQKVNQSEGEQITENKASRKQDKSYFDYLSYLDPLNLTSPFLGPKNKSRIRSSKDYLYELRNRKPEDIQKQVIATNKALMEAAAIDTKNAINVISEGNSEIRYLLYQDLHKEITEVYRGGLDLFKREDAKNYELAKLDEVIQKEWDAWKKEFWLRMIYAFQGGGLPGTINALQRWSDNWMKTLFGGMPV